MRYLISSLLLTANVFAATLNLTGTVKAESGDLIKDAVVLLKVNGNLIAYARALSDASGKFTLLPGKEAPGEIATPIAKPADILAMKFAGYQVMDLKGRSHSFNNLPQGIYVLLGKTERGKIVNLGKFYHKGGALKIGEATQKEQKIKNLAKLVTASGDSIQLIVRKTGYLPEEVEFSSFNEDVGTVILKRDSLEDRIDSVMALMNLDAKIYQMTQPLVGSFGNGTYLYGSVLHGGDGYSSTILSSMRNALNSYSVKIPVTYGKDMMHGAAAISGATIFPHNIGMGATRDSNLVRRACEVTAKESWAGNVDLIFGPAIPVPQNERWGRVYEGFGETAELAVMMGAACIRGYQGDKYNAPWRVIATAKHFLGDGATDNGVDRGNSSATDSVLRALHLPGYEAAVEQGVLSVMASFNQIRGTHQHVDSERLTGWLKTELGFDGYVIGDWAGISNSTNPGSHDGCSYGCTTPTNRDAVGRAINAGVDMGMNEGDFVTNLKTLVNSGTVPQARIDDAVRRILRAKFRANRMDNIQGPAEYAGKANLIGSTEHRAVAREAVRKSLVLLKNENSALPISKAAKVYVMGTSYANNVGNQCGGWTLGWSSAPSDIPGATSIPSAIAQVATASVSTAAAADVIVYVTGEVPYAEWEGDIEDITFPDANATQLSTYKSQGKKIVTVFISGRPREANSLLEASDAFVAAWLPGSEGAGVADFLFGDHAFDNRSNKLPHTWPRNKAVFPVNSTEESPNWFPYGFGLRY
ncbi:MAG: glycoside hydrolase family 3 C-terminal domain-containing protein [Fibromonadales bacterium]|nr:glycoside hydrolase family 3 C-terminal domain-containing protein [Fibromonadales bacterium]